MNINMIKKLFLVMLVPAFSISLSDAAFVKELSGARPGAMGGAFTAVGGDVNSIGSNPAGLSLIQVPEASFMYSKLYAGVEGVNLGAGYIAFAMPLRDGSVVGFAWNKFSSPNEYEEDVMALSYARGISDIFSLGINAKYLGHKFTIGSALSGNPVFSGGTSKSAVSFDAGMLARFIIDKNSREAIGAGLYIRNVNQPDLGLLDEDKVPAEVVLGAAYMKGDKILPSLDISYRMQDWGSQDDKLNIRLGIETTLVKDFLLMRAGANKNEAAFGFSVIPALWNTRFSVDYTFLWPFLVRDSYGSHQMSLSFKFAK